MAPDIILSRYTPELHGQMFDLLYLNHHNLRQSAFYSSNLVRVILQGFV